MEHIINCNLDLCLSPPSSSSSSSSAATDSTSTSTSQHSHNSVSRIGVFPVTDLTELQARAIIVRATRQMEERRSTCRIREEATSSSPVEQLSMKSGASPSMRRSLQRFLQKRKHRIQTISPYTH